MISVVCCYNKIPELERMRESLQKQDCEYELIAVDNTTGSFSSASAALNHGATQAKGDIIVFLHQDIMFAESSSLREFVVPLMLDGKCVDLIGIHGAVHGDAGYIGKYRRVDTLDECCVAMRKDTWTQYPFNGKLCDGWHLYTVELCLRMRAENKQIATGTFAIQHLSSGTVDDAYMATFRKLMSVYKHEKWIKTTCKSLPNNMLVFWVYWLLWKSKKVLLGNYQLVHHLKTLFRRKQ